MPVRLTLAISALVALLAACMPVAAPGVTHFVAAPEDVIAAIADVAVDVRPGHDFTGYGVERISERSIVLVARWHPTLATLFGRGERRIEFTAAQYGPTTLVAVHAEGGGRRDAEHILTAVERRLERLHDR